MRHLISYPTIHGWLSHLQRDMIAGRCRRTPGGPWCPSRMGTAVDDEFPSTEMPTATNHQKEISSQASYVIHGHTLAETDTAKYLGVSLYKYLFWSPHVNATAKKANGTRTFLHRNLSKAPTAVKTPTYESLIRPIIEYSSLAQDVNKLERWSNTGTPATHPGTMVEPAASLPSWKLSAWNP